MASHPTKIGKYDVDGILGRGGMGVVYKALDRQIGRFVAIKMILSDGDESLLERFRSEARSTGSLQCPNIVTVYDFGEQDGNPYLVMQFLEGSSLESMIQKGVQLSFSERLGIIIDVCNGLAYAHQRGVIHRDIKPANIMVLQDGVNDGMGVIVDFGIARIGGGGTRLTRTDQIVGSVHYMSAEQLQAKDLDNRTDIYATGVVLFQLLTGALPFDAHETAATLLKIVNEPPPPLSTYLKEYPVELEAIIARALAKKREDRYGSAKEFALDLMQVQEHLKSETVVQLIRRAEASLGREEWTKAREQLQQVLRIDRQNTQAQKMMNAVQERLRQQQQIEQARALRSQADEAYMDQRYDDALRLLDQAVTLDPKNSDLQTLRESARLSKERATGLRRALRRAEAALQDGDIDEAQSAVVEAFEIDPHDTQAKALKVIISQHAEERARQQQLQKLLDRARNQVAARDLAGAFETLKKAEALDPTSNDLQSVVRMAVSAREQERRRTETEESRRQIETALVHEDYATAVAKAEEGLRKYPNEQSLLKLKALAEAQRARTELKKFVRDQFAAANSLADAGQQLQALAILDRALQRAPGNSELESLRSTLQESIAAEESELQKQRAMDSMLAEAKRIFQERGAGSASDFLDAHASPYAQFPQVRELYEAVQAREALDVLDGMLANESNPAKRVQLAEEAARSNPENDWIRQRLAELQQVRARISAAMDRAEGFEARGRVSDAFQEWQQLKDAYPKVPEFDAQIHRLANLVAEQAKPAAEPTVSVKPASRSKSAGSPTKSSSATSVFDSAVAPNEAPTRVVPAVKTQVPPPPARKIPSPPSPVTPPREPVGRDHRGPQQQNLLAGPKKFIAIAVGVVVLAVVGYLVFGGGQNTVGKVNVEVAMNPPDAQVLVGPQKCQTPSPCKLQLRPGKYDLRVEKEGFVSSTQPVVVGTGMKPLSVTLTAILGRGKLAVQTNVDGVAVLVDGVSSGEIGRDKKLDIELTEGSHEVSVKKDGYEQLPAERIAILKNNTVPLAFSLTKITTQGFLEITSKPGAEVSIDHRLFGHVPPSGLLSVQVKPGKHRLELTLDGYLAWPAKPNVKADEHLPIRAELIAKPPPQTSPTQTKPPSVVSFRASPEAIQQKDQSVILSWETQNADQVEIDQGIGPVEKSSSKQVSPKETTTYTLTAKGSGGTVTGTAKISVDIAPPPPPAKPLIEQFEPGQDTIQSGKTTKLYWRTQNATDVSIDQDVGSGLPGNGSRPVSPSHSTKYTLVAKGAGGEATASTGIAVDVGSDKGDAKQCVDRFKEAYQSKDIAKVINAWPRLAQDKKLQKQFQDEFKFAKAIRIDDLCGGAILGPEDTAHLQCEETAVEDFEGRDQHTTATFEYVCHRKAAGWFVDDRIKKVDDRIKK